ncbi:MAG: AraC family transcriptional regulator [Anaerolineae bacterium]
MEFDFDYRPSDSPRVELVWRSHSTGGGTFLSTATSRTEMIITRQQGTVQFSVRGPETQASIAPVPEEAEFIGIQFKLGTFIPCLPIDRLVNNGINLPEAGSQTFWLHGSAWQLPDFDQVDTFVDRLERQGLLRHDPLVDALIEGKLADRSARSVQRHFRRATGITHGTVIQIERAHQAANLLRQGVPILDTVEQAGYYDQPHLTRSLRHLFGQTPTQIARDRAVTG